MEAHKEGPEAGEGQDYERGLEDLYASHVGLLRLGLGGVFDVGGQRPTEVGRSGWDVVAFLATEANAAGHEGERCRTRR